jgi:predicted DNA-binding transcriptional regulator AlpA
MERDGRFPRRVQLGSNAVGWYLDEVDQWLETRRTVPSPDGADQVTP